MLGAVPGVGDIGGFSSVSAHFAVLGAADLALCQFRTSRSATSVGQGDALELIFISPSVNRQIRDRYAAFIHLSAVENQITTAYFISDVSKHNSACLIYFCKYRTKCDYS